MEREYVWEFVYLPIVSNFYSLDPNDMMCHVDCECQFCYACIHKTLLSV